MARRYQRTAVAPVPNFRYLRWGDDIHQPIMVDSDNGTTMYGRILAGTVMSMNAGGDAWRPCGVQELDGPIAAANIAEVDDSSNFYLADVIDILAAADTFDAVTIVASAGGPPTADILCTALEAGGSNLEIELIDPPGNNVPLSMELADYGAARVLEVTCATDGASAITSTVQEVIDIINTSVYMSAALAAGVAADVAIAVAATALAGGVLIGDTIAGARNITLIDAVAVPNEITFDGAAVTAPAGAVVAMNDIGERIPWGILEDDLMTLETDPSTGVQTGVQQPGNLAMQGVFRQSGVTGWDRQMVPYLLPQSILEGWFALGERLAPANFGLLVVPA